MFIVQHWDTKKYYQKSIQADGWGRGTGQPVWGDVPKVFKTMGQLRNSIRHCRENISGRARVLHVEFVVKDAHFITRKDIGFDK